MITPQTLRAIIALQNHIVEAGPEVERVMDAVVRELATFIPAATGAVVEMCDGDDMVYRAASGALATFVGLRLPRAGSLSDLCAELCTALYAADTANDPRVNAEVCRRVDVRSMICQPLMAGTRCIAVCKAASDKPAAFTPADLEALGMVASLIGASLHHASRFDLAVRAGRVDALTNVANRRSYDEELGRHISHAQRAREPLSVALFDLDKFKLVNDTFGHGAGDAVLQTFAAVLEANVRASDRVFRIGGDEFCVLLPCASEESARALVSRIEEALSVLEIDGRRIAFSAGVAELRPLDDGMSLTRRADARMYDDKRRIARGGDQAAACRNASNAASASPIPLRP